MVARRIPTGIHPLWEGVNEAAAGELVALLLKDELRSVCSAPAQPRRETLDW